MFFFFLDGFAPEIIVEFAFDFIADEIRHSLGIECVELPGFVPGFFDVGFGSAVREFGGGPYCSI